MSKHNNLALKAPVYVTHGNTAAAGAQTDGYIFVSDGYYEVEEVCCNYDVAGGSGAQVDVMKVPSGTTIASGTSTLASAFVLTGAADASMVRSSGTLTATAANRLLSPGDSLGLDYSGTLTGLLGVAVTVRLRRVRQNF